MPNNAPPPVGRAGPSTPPDDPRLGRTLGGKWRLDRLLGVGGMASVYAACHRNGASAAIKILHPQYARLAEARMRFLREAYIANKAGKGAVLVLDDDVDEEGSPYLVMELLRGEAVDLRAHRLGGRLEVREVAWVAAQTLATLEVAHGQGIIHRDLKPENLFWTEDHRIKILDFGIARLRESTESRGGGEDTRTGMIMGTPGFMAPEQALGNMSEIDARTDLWAVGAIMFRLLSARDVHGETTSLVVAATKRAPSVGEVEPGLPEAIVGIVDRALRFERAARYPDARSMRLEVDAFLDEEGEESTLSSPGNKRDAAGERSSGPLALPVRIATPPPGPSEDTPGLASQMSGEDNVVLRDLFALADRALDALKERGPDDPQTVARMDEAFGFVRSALSAAHIGLFWNVTSHGFLAGEAELVWQPRPPRPQTPARMYEDGVRMLGLLPGLTRMDFDLLLRMLADDTTLHGSFAATLEQASPQNLVYRLETQRGDSGLWEDTGVGPSTSSNRTQISAVLGALATTDDPELRTALLARLAPAANGRENDIALLLERAGAPLALDLVRLLDDLDTPEARDALRAAATHRHSLVRIEALSRLDPTDPKVREELSRILEGSLPGMRIVALAEIERHGIQAAGPLLSARIRSAGFDALPVEERRHILSAFAALQPARAEAVAVELLLGARSGAGEAQDATRELAAELLGKAATQEAVEALSAASKARWQSSERARAAAAKALAQLSERKVRAAVDTASVRPPSGYPTLRSATKRPSGPPAKRSSSPPAKRTSAPPPKRQGAKRSDRPPHSPHRR